MSVFSIYLHIGARTSHLPFLLKKNYFRQIIVTRVTSAIAPIITVTDSGDVWVVGVGVGVVGTIDGNSCSVMTGDGIEGVAGWLFTIVNRVDPVTSIAIPETFTIYSSGLNVDASTGNDHRFNVPLPGSTFTVPEAPENSAFWDLDVGLKDDEVISTNRLSSTARLVEPVMVNCSPTT